MTTPLEPVPAPQLPFSAVFVDLENMAINPDPDHPSFDLARVMKQVRVLSNPIVRMGFADWSKLPQFSRAFVLQGFDQIQSTYVSGSKNSADMQMCVDALEVVLLRREINTVFLVSGDADFTPLARAVRRQGRQVFGIGWRDKVSLVFRRNCDRFFAYEELPGLSIDEASEMAVAERRSERRLASQQSRRSVAAYRPGVRPGKQRRGGRGEPESGAEVDEKFLADPRDGGGEAPEIKGGGAKPEPAEARERDKPEPRKPREAPAVAADPLARLREAPVAFLGGDQQFAVLEALHRELCAQSGPRRRNQIVAAVAQKLDDVRRQQVAAVERILWHAKAYDVVDRAGQRNSLLWNVQLRPKNRDFDELRRVHDIQLIADAAEAGIFLGAEDWSEQLYGGPEDADVIAEYFREAAAISPAFVKETGIAPPAAEDAEGESAGDEAAPAGEGEESAGEPEAMAEAEPGGSEPAADEAEAGKDHDDGEDGGEADSEDGSDSGSAEVSGEEAEGASGEEEAEASDDEGEAEPEAERESEPESESGPDPAEDRPAEPPQGDGEDRGAAADAETQQALFEEPERRARPADRHGPTFENEPEEASGGEDSAESRRSGWWSRL